MTSSFKINKKLPTDLKTVNPFVEQIARKLLALTKAEDEVFKVKLALEEALTNAMLHGNALKPQRKVAVHIAASRKKIMLDVHDQGEGFDFRGLPDPTKKKHAAKPSGRGVYLMRKLMDEVKFYDRGSGVKITKSFF